MSGHRARENQEARGFCRPAELSQVLIGRLDCTDCSLEISLTILEFHTHAFPDTLNHQAPGTKNISYVYIGRLA